jgi:hypothetical protein
METKKENSVSKDTGLSTSALIGIIGTIVVVFTLGIISISYQQPETLTSNSPYPSPSLPIMDVPTQNTPPLDVSALTPQMINKIVQKIRSAPNTSCGGYPCIKTTFDSGVAVVTLIYELAADPLTPGSKEALVVEINTKDYIDENGKNIPQDKIFEVLLSFRDTDFDATPNDYWSTGFGQDLNYEVLTRNTPNIVNILATWTFVINYFNQNLF